ncbi:zinc metalloprotease, partial [Streptomyces sp. NPDC013433]
LPSKIPALWDAAFGDGPREPDSPMGVVGAARKPEFLYSLITSSKSIALSLHVIIFIITLLPQLLLD